MILLTIWLAAALLVGALWALTGSLLSEHPVSPVSAQAVAGCEGEAA